MDATQTMSHPTAVLGSAQACGPDRPQATASSLRPILTPATRSPQAAPAATKRFHLQEVRDLQARMDAAALHSITRPLTQL